MGAPVQQAHGLMLAMDLDQTRADVLECRHTGGLIIDKGTRAAIGPEDAAQDQLLARLGLEAALFNGRNQFGIVGRDEHSRRHRLFGPATHQTGIAACAQRQTQRIQNNRLTRAGFTGQNRQPLLDLKVQSIDENHITDGKTGQHGSL